MIQGLDYVSRPVDDLPAAIRFYRDVLGLRLLFELPDRWAELDVGGFRLALYPREADEGRGGDLALTVDDLAAEMARLEAQGVSFPYGVVQFEVPTGSGRLARFRDPSGNRLELVEKS